MNLEDLKAGESWACKFKVLTFLDDDGNLIDKKVNLGEKHPGKPGIYEGLGIIKVRDIEKNSSKNKTEEPNLIQEEINLSQTIGFKTKITYNKNGKGNIKIFYNNLEQYNFLINKLKN